jgi:hypothetical protein
MIGFVLTELVIINYGDVQIGTEDVVDFLEIQTEILLNIQTVVGFFLIILLGLLNPVIRLDL